MAISLSSWRCVALTALVFIGYGLAAVSADHDEPELDAEQRALLDEFIHYRPENSDPSGIWMLEAWDTDAGLERLTRFPARNGNAAAHFKRLEELYPTEKDTLGIAETAGERELLAAAELAQCRLTPTQYPEYDRLDAPQPDFIVIRSYLKALLTTANRLELQDGDIAGAEKRIQAALLCSRHLTRDRSSLIIYMMGILSKSKAAQEYELFLRRRGDADKAELCKAYHDKLNETMRLLLWKSKTALGTLANFASLPVALQVVKNDHEACWRAQAVLQLAIFRHGAPDTENNEILRHPGWEKAAEQALAAIAANDPTPSVRRLAVWSVLNIHPGMFDEMRQQF